MCSLRASDHAACGEELTAKRAPSHPADLGADLFRGTVQPVVAKALHPQRRSRSQCSTKSPNEDVKSSLSYAHMSVQLL